MIIHFYLRFHSNFGQRIFVSGNIESLGNFNPLNSIALQFVNDQWWQGTVEAPETSNIIYRYILREDTGREVLDADGEREVNLNISGDEIILIDTWNHPSKVENVFYTKPFRTTLITPQNKNPKIAEPKFYTHEFHVKAPLLAGHEWVCITGSAKAFKNWDVEKLLPLKPKGDWFSIKVNLSKEEYPVHYKYGIYDTKNKTFIYEEGSNHILIERPQPRQKTILHDGFLNLYTRWKGTGVAIPVFSLRSKNSFGTGEFADIKLLVNWARQTGLKLLQFLPVNDTISSNTSMDSYPYSAISAFALHPLYINLDKVAGPVHKSLINSLNKKKKQLNALPFVNYVEVMKFKLSALKELYEAKKDSFFADTDYFEFFELNRHWLVPYAAFSFLRDKYKTANFYKWKTNKIYNESAIQNLVSSSQPHYHAIAFYYFVQYHLHLQLTEASEYAHSKGIILKGDIPIGISKNSCDAWVDPSLYNMDEQAGAPPDDFSVKGQNWGFPTYNWRHMQLDNFSWWRNRLQQMDNYFDAFRIDHILGFFRIWSIPKHAVEGILGRFVPDVPVDISEFSENKIWFDHDRYCKPFINEAILQRHFGQEVELVKDTFLTLKENELYGLKEDFNTQRKIENYFENHPIENSLEIKTGLYDLVSNIILLEEENSNGQKFHFRIAIDKTSSFQGLDPHTQEQLRLLYINYFFRRQEDLWQKEAMQKLPALKNSTNMLICGEDLGMVPHSVPEVMNELGILSLEVERMPKDSKTEFFHPRNAPYLSVVTPSTHDMSTIRGWWEEDKNKTQKFYNYQMGHYGQAPFYCEPWINKEIILQHLYSPAMWSIFQLQDILGMSEKLRRKDPDEERINQPADPNHYWNYRMHINLEDLIKQKEFNKELFTYTKQSGRS